MKIRVKSSFHCCAREGILTCSMITTIDGLLGRGRRMQEYTCGQRKEMRRHNIP